MIVNGRELLITSNTLGSDLLVDKILSEPDSAEYSLYLKAKAIRSSSLKKSYIESSLLATSDLGEISDILEMPVELIEMYSHIYYDVVELDRLSKMELLEVTDKAEANLKLWAVSAGMSFLAWRLGKEVNISPIDGLRDLFTTCIYKSKEAIFNANISEASKESTKWVKLSMDLARLLKVWVLDSAAAKHDIELALREIIPDFGGLDVLEEEMLKMDSNAKEATETLEVSADIPKLEVSTEVEIDTNFSLDDLQNINLQS